MRGLVWRLSELWGQHDVECFFKWLRSKVHTEDNAQCEGSGSRAPWDTEPRPFWIKVSSERPSQTKSGLG